MPHFLIYLLPAIFVLLCSVEWTNLVFRYSGKFKGVTKFIVPVVYYMYGATGYTLYHFLDKIYRYADTKVAAKVGLVPWSYVAVICITITFVVITPQFINGLKKEH